VTDDGSQQRKPDFRTAVENIKAIATVLATEAESVLGRRTARFLGVLVLFAVVVGTLLGLLNWYIAPSGAAQKKDVVATLAQILGGAALLSGLYFTWRTLQVNREGQITERFTRAIEQLGATDGKGKPRLEIRLGGIYGLERIAKDSPERDYSTIMEVLTAYVRRNAPRSPNEGHKPTSVTNEATEQHKDTEQNRPSAAPKPSADIQAVLDVLARYEEDFVPVQSPVRRSCK
jgi:hypothetical protein